MRRLDHRSRSRRRRPRRRIGRCRSTRRNCQSCQELHRQIFETAFGKEMKNLRRIGLGVFLALAQLAHGQFSAQLAEASKPLTEGVPEVAVIRLQTLLKQTPSEPDWRAVAERLLQAMVAANQTADAFNLLADPRLRQSSSASFWRAQLLATSHHEAEALPLYRQIAADSNSGLRMDALFGAAETLRALGRTDEALQSFSELFRDPKWHVRAQLRAAELYLDKSDAVNARKLLEKVQPTTTAEKRERHFLRGRLEMVLHRPDRAITIFESVLKNPEGTTHETLTAALFALADTHLQLKTPETGDDALENFIEHRPSDVDLARIFAKLDELYRAERKPSRAELDRWTRDPAEPRRAFAQWYLARFDLRLGRRDRALECFAALRRTRPQLPILASAFLEFARLELEDRHFGEALAILNDARSLRPEPAVMERVNFLAAQIQYHGKNFDAAIADFEQIGRSDSTLAPVAMFNAALSWLQKGDEARFLANAEEFGNKTKDEKSGADLRLEAGLMEAARGDSRAADSLRNFLRDFPRAERASEAWVALAELAFHASPPQIDEARKDLARAAESKSTPAAQERADYLTIWLEDATPGGEAKVIELAKRFIQQHESSSLVASARMKLGEMYYRAEDFANAETQFELLTEQNSTGGFTERVLFFAGESAMASMAAQSLDRALVLFDRVVQLNGELKWAARNEQAVIDEGMRPDRPHEFFWFYKAGFNAGQLLEADAKWESAAAVYEKLAAASGTRSDEARERLDRLRLEHFLRQE